MRHPMHELLARLLEAGRLAPGRDNDDPKPIDSRNEIDGTPDPMNFQRAYDSRDARGN